MYSNVSESLKNVREALEAIRSSDAFLIGVRDQIERFKTHSQFGFDQVLDVEQHMKELHASLELDKFSLVKIREEALKVLRSQANVEPNIALQLLKDTIKQGTAEGTEQASAPPAQTSSIQDSERV